MKTKRKIAEKIIEIYFSISFRSVKLVESEDNEIIISYDRIEDSLEFPYSKIRINKYEYGVYQKEVIEDYAKKLGLKAVWIDLNDLSKDEAYYFRNCNDVYKSLIDFEIKK